CPPAAGVRAISARGTARARTRRLFCSFIGTLAAARAAVDASRMCLGWSLRQCRKLPAGASPLYRPVCCGGWTPGKASRLAPLPQGEEPGGSGGAGFGGLAVGVVAGAHQRAGGDVAEPERMAERGQRLEFIRGPVAQHRVVVRAGLQVLA